METKVTVKTEEIKKEDLFLRLSEQDKRNLQKLSTDFQEVAKKNNLKVHLLVVGGILEKLHPRKDIDVIVVFEQENFPKQEAYKNFHIYSLAAFKYLERVLKETVKDNPNTKIGDIVPPSIDEEFGSPAILKHDWSIKLIIRNGTPIDVIREPQVGLENVVASREKPFTIL